MRLSSDEIFESPERGEEATKSIFNIKKTKKDLTARELAK